jgi:hypothetical protein
MEVFEAPGSSDQDGILEPSDEIRIAITLANTGTLPARATIELTSEQEGLHLPAEPVETDTIEPGETIVHDVDVSMDGSACGEELAIEATSHIAHRQWHGEAAFRPGVLEATTDPLLSAGEWVANPDGSDTATNGAWEHGVPKATFFAGRELQPNGGAGGADDPAWFTGPTQTWNLGEVGGGATTLVTEDYELGSYTAPTLQFKLWYLAVDRTPTSIDPAADSHLTIEGSSDGGESWTVVEELVSDPVRWETHVVALDGLDTSGKLRFRFTAHDDENDQRLVEVGIDDIGFGSFAASCGGESGGCGCSARGNERDHSWLLLIPVALVWRRRQR